MKSLNQIVLDQTDILKAVEYLRQGELVAFSTETVYGLGADASNEAAINKLYVTKGRPDKHPVIVHLADIEQINNWCRDIPDYALAIANRFWPGPLTLIAKKKAHVSMNITGGQDTVGIRIPAHPIAQALLKTFGGGIAAPSANKYGRVSSTCAEHVKEEFGDEVKMILDGGKCLIGIESTIVDVTGTSPRILRPGFISEGDLLDVIGNGLLKNISEDCNSTARIRVPGSDKSHYAPRTPVLLLDKSSFNSFFEQNTSGQYTYAVLALNKCVYNNCNIKEYIEIQNDPRLYANILYANLRQLDKAGADYIVIEEPQNEPEWAAINDRLRRAAAK